MGFARLHSAFRVDSLFAVLRSAPAGQGWPYKPWSRASLLCLRRAPALLAALILLTPSDLHGVASLHGRDQAGRVSGTVLDATTSQPIASATVTLSPLRGSNVVTLETGADGTFAFDSLAPGAYALKATASNHAPGAFGRIWPGGPSRELRVAPGEDVRVRLHLWMFAALSGSVRNERDEPLSGVLVQLVQHASVRRAGNVPLRLSTRTDAHGAYRFDRLPPGRYMAASIQAYGTTPASVAAGASHSQQPARLATLDGSVAPSRADGGEPRIYRTTFAPSALERRSADVFSLKSGDEVRDVDIVMVAERALRVSGSVTSQGLPLARVLVRLARVASSPDDSETQKNHATTMTDSEGRFALLGVPSGDYVLEAEYRVPAQKDRAAAPTIDPASRLPVMTGSVAGVKPTTEANPLLFAYLPVTIGDSDIRGLDLTLAPVTPVSGRFHFDGGAEPPTRTALAAAVPALDCGAGLTIRAVLREDGSFTLNHPPRRRCTLIPPVFAGWYATAATASGNDVLNRSFDMEQASGGVVMAYTDRPASFNGTVSPMVRAASVFVFPDDAALWASPTAPFRVLKPTPDGAFVSGALPPGTYVAAAVDAATTFDVDWREPEMLKKLSSAGTRVRVREGDTRSVRLKAHHIE